MFMYFIKFYILGFNYLFISNLKLKEFGGNVSDNSTNANPINVTPIQIQPE